MKRRIFSIVIMLAVFTVFTYSQDADAIKKLNTKIAADTLLGWKTGGVLNLNLAQTSLTNWVAGGQNSVAFNGLFSAFAQW
jgi:hypothetical protein